MFQHVAVNFAIIENNESLLITWRFPSLVSNNERKYIRLYSEVQIFLGAKNENTNFV